MKKVTLTLVLIMVITTILSTNIFAVEIPLGVVVNRRKNKLSRCTTFY